MPFRRCKTTIVDPKSGTCSLSNLKILVKVHHSHFSPYPWQTRKWSVIHASRPHMEGIKRNACKYRGKKQCQKGTNCLKVFFVPIARSTVCFVQVTLKGITFSKYQLLQSSCQAHRSNVVSIFKRILQFNF